MTTETSTAFDGSGQPVLAVPFDFDAVEGEIEQSREADAEEIRIKREAIVAFLRYLASGRNAKMTGRKVHLLAYICKVSDCKSQKALAKRLRVTPAAVSMQLNSLRQGMRLLTRVL